MSDLHVDVVSRDNDAGPTVVLTHGLGDSAATWSALVEPLAATGSRVVTWDLRGHGRSPAPADPAAYSRDTAIADLLEVIGDTAPVTLVGHSLGGYLSLFVALLRPELVTTLVMIASGPGFRDPDARAEWNAYVDRAAAKMAIPPAASGLCHQPDAWVIEHLPSLRSPLVQVVGGEDRRFHDGVAYVQRVLPDSTAVTVPGAGHHPQRTHPAEVLAAIGAADLTADDA